MIFFHKWKNIPQKYKNAVLAIGNFDGFHLGHRSVINYAVQLGKKLNRPVALMTFEPHPSYFFRPGTQTFRITPIRSKVRAICTLPIDAFFVLSFNSTLSNMSADDFVKDVLIKELHISALVVGQDYSFGKHREGNIQFLEQKYPEISVHAVEQKKDNANEVISSSRIRSFIKMGDMKSAFKLMGHSFEIEGYVIHGFKRGRTIGYPTLNIAPNESILPKLGVYAARVLIDNKYYPAIANIGCRPTVAGEGVLLEAHIIDFNQDLYGKRLRVFLDDFIRPEQKFDNLNELKIQIIRDIEQAKGILK